MAFLQIRSFIISIIAYGQNQNRVRAIGSEPYGKHNSVQCPASFCQIIGDIL